MSPVPYTWGPFLAKIFLKIDEIKIRPLTQNHFNTLPVLVADACIQEGWEKNTPGIDWQQGLQPSTKSVHSFVEVKKKKKN